MKSALFVNATIGFSENLFLVVGVPNLGSENLVSRSCLRSRYCQGLLENP